MRKILSLLLLIAMLLTCCSALAAEVHINEQVPDDWYERDLMRLTIFPTLKNDAMLLECGGKTMLIDGGFKGWAKKLVKALNQLGITEVDYAFNTHPDDDHIGTLTSIVKNGTLGIGQFLSSFPVDWDDKNQRAAVRALEAAGIPYVLLTDDQVMDFGGASIHFMRRRDVVKHNNGMSTATFITYGDATIMLTADMNNASLALMVDYYGDALDCDIVKIPHHGMCYIEPEFLEKTSPALLVCTNSSKGVKKEVRAQIKAHGWPTLYHSMGPIIMETDGTVWYVHQDTAHPTNKWPGN